ncbi:MAG: hypothetical protein ACFB0A_16660 [Croceivirga sp.]
MRIRIQFVKPSFKTIIDLVAHYLVAIWILSILYYMLDIGHWLNGNPMVICSGLALLIIPIRLFANHLLQSHQQDKYLKKILDELLNDKS